MGWAVGHILCYALLLDVYSLHGFWPALWCMTTQFLNMALPHVVAGGYAEVAEYITGAINVGQGMLASLPDIASNYAGRALLVADSNTAKLISSAVLNSFNHYTIQGEYCASTALVDCVKNASKSADFIIALGSGSINDVCKYVSKTEGKEYILFPTAPSMNGYTSPNASITIKNGTKKSFAGQLPRAIYIDTGTLANAPARMINSGFADFVCRSTARADWLLSHIFLGTQYSELPFLISEDVEHALVESYQGLVARDVDTIMLLMQALLLSGVGMIIAGGSQSASQGEHILACATELLDDYNLLHGERVGVATVVLAKLQKKLCNMQPRLVQTCIDSRSLQQYFGRERAQEFYDVLLRKSIDSEAAKSLTHVISEKWEYISERVRAEVIDPTLLERILHDLKSPYLPEHVGWTTARYGEVANLAFATRDRFTFLDIAHHAQVPVM
ncbi:sn-glycerol-1-phosphate dehydrogenase [Anaplasma marginale]|uniref:sn-glycerol-1-phosphate dehydrogenase n=2 Tax=Anaplasma marginale TaxID=770 RepID=A0A643CLX3_ANAMA|nr:sn-glycerol-1-phosphate dehydrogenase [Anaplasma marginale]AXW85279.1 sn-glycerol-1-phosphate dehydrogenase [Anaplasma marginale]KAA8472549.1 sn-glycerol-1-phosphate dehydrogenase [Anaplasma marginale]KAA8474501.1 sn-glycerol-1-phosphate dehydrogenase [Anaplasma marginale]KAB0450970.1 sn-glycerol-1-phosphate dehydrogenase [Anaplasma marginale]